MSIAQRALQRMFTELRSPMIRVSDLKVVDPRTRQRLKGILIEAPELGYRRFWHLGRAGWLSLPYPLPTRETSDAAVSTGVAPNALVYVIGVAAIGDLMAAGRRELALAPERRLEILRYLDSCEIFLARSIRQSLSGPYAQEAFSRADEELLRHVRGIASMDWEDDGEEVDDHIEKLETESTPDEGLDLTEYAELINRTYDRAVGTSAKVLGESDLEAIAWQVAGAVATSALASEAELLIRDIIGDGSASSLRSGTFRDESGNVEAAVLEVTPSLKVVLYWNGEDMEWLRGVHLDDRDEPLHVSALQVDTTHEAVAGAFQISLAILIGVWADMLGSLGFQIEPQELFPGETAAAAGAKTKEALVGVREAVLRLADPLGPWAERTEDDDLSQWHATIMNPELRALVDHALTI